MIKHSAWEYVLGQTVFTDIVNNILQGNPVVLKTENDMRELVVRLVLLSEYLEEYAFLPEDVDFAIQWIENAMNSYTFSTNKESE